MCNILFKVLSVYWTYISCMHDSLPAVSSWSPVEAVASPGECGTGSSGNHEAANWSPVNLSSSSGHMPVCSNPLTAFSADANFQ